MKKILTTLIILATVFIFNQTKVNAILTSNSMFVNGSEVSLNDEEIIYVSVLGTSNYEVNIAITDKYSLRQSFQEFQNMKIEITEEMTIVSSEYDLGELKIKSFKASPSQTIEYKIIANQLVLTIDGETMLSNKSSILYNSNKFTLTDNSLRDQVIVLPSSAMNATAGQIKLTNLDGLLINNKNQTKKIKLNDYEMFYRVNSQLVEVEEIVLNIKSSDIDVIINDIKLENVISSKKEILFEYNQNKKTATVYYDANQVSSKRLYLEVGKKYSDYYESMKGGQTLNKTAMYHFYTDNEYQNELDMNGLVTDSIELYAKIGYSNTPNVIISFNEPLAPIIIDYPTYNIKPNDSFWLKNLNINLPVPTKDGYIFDAWYLDSELSEKYNNTLIKSDITLYAKWEEMDKDVNVNFTLNSVSYNSNDYKWLIDGVNTNKTTVIAKTGEVLNYDFAIPQRKGYVFKGWKDEHDNLVDLSKPITSDINLYAKWENRKGFNITYETNGGVYIGTINYPSSSYTKLEHKIPVKDKNLFIAWFEDEELTIPAKESLNINDMDYYNITLYAAWKYNGAYIYFETNAPGLEISPRLVTKGTELNIPLSPKRNGYVFTGWYLDSDLTLVYNGEPVEDDRVTLYAGWAVDPDAVPTNPDSELGKKDNTGLYTTIIALAGVGLLYILFRKKGR